ncbi:MAG: hypothetical protein ACRCYQ_14940 [Nocardioides sp.]
MNRGVAGVLVAGCLGLGAASGWLADRPPEVETRSIDPGPIVAQSPAQPQEALPSEQPDVPGLPLSGEFELAPTTVGDPVLFRLTAPAGWTAIPLASPRGIIETKWVPPDYVDELYFVRARGVGYLGNSPEELRTNFEKLVAERRGYRREEGSGPDTLLFSYLDDRAYRRYQVISWTSGDSDTAQAEIAGTGRRADLDGMKDLVRRITDSVAPPG